MTVLLAVPALLLIAVVFGWPVLSWLASMVEGWREHRRTKRRFCSPGVSLDRCRSPVSQWIAREWPTARKTPEIL